MGKKTRKAIEKLGESVEKSQKRNAKLLEDQTDRIIEALEEQTESNRELSRLLRSYLGDSGEDREHEKARSVSAQNEDQSSNHQGNTTEREVTEAAERRAGELGVDLDEVKGTGSGGRVVVSDVEEAAAE